MTQTVVRADSRSGTAVTHELEWTPGLDCSGIEVTVIGGQVLMTGHVGTYPQKLRAIAAVRRVHGVTSIQENLVVSNSWAVATDADISDRASEALWDAVDFPDSVEVTVEGRVVSLSGEVTWNFQREAAAGAVRDIPGVRDVRNTIGLRPGVMSAGITTAITDAFRRSAELRDEDITVTAEFDGLIILDGTVHSWSRSTEAERVAWCAPGAAVVANHLQIRV